MEEIRCTRCKRLLGRYRECLELEIKCPRCGAINRRVDEPPSGTFPRNSGSRRPDPVFLFQDLREMHGQ